MDASAGRVVGREKKRAIKHEERGGKVDKVAHPLSLSSAPKSLKPITVNNPLLE